VNFERIGSILRAKDENHYWAKNDFYQIHEHDIMLLEVHSLTFLEGIGEMRCHSA
jgi:hypothetical protein